MNIPIIVSQLLSFLFLRFLKEITKKSIIILKIYLFLIESGLLGTAGGAIGLLLGYLLAKSVQLIGGIYLGEGIIILNFPLWLMLGALAFSFLVGTVSGILPAVQGSKMNPVDSLRFRK